MPQQPSLIVSHRAIALTLSFLTGLSLSANTLAQSHAGRMVIAEDDGSGPQIFQFSMPDFIELKNPDFIKRDVPTFTEKLVLSEEQTSVVQRLIEEILEAFKKLTMEHLPKGPQGMHINLGGAGGGGGDAEGEPGMIVLGPGMGQWAGGEAGEAEGIELPDIGELMEGDPDLEGVAADVPGGMKIGVMVSVGELDGEDGGGGGGGGAVVSGDSGVAVSFDSADGEEISPEVRKKLEEAAAKMAEQMKARIEKQMAEGGGHEAMPFMGEAMNIEDMQKHHEEMEAKAEEFRKAKAGLRQTFVNDVQTNLAEPQIQRWPDLERTLLRTKSLPKGRLSGERTDLVKVLKSVDLSEADRRPIAEPLQNYEYEMDIALKQRNDFIPACEKKIDAALKADDTDKALSIIDRAASLRVAVRAVNEQFTDMIAMKMPAEKAAAFRSAVAKFSFPSVYKTTQAQKLFAATAKVEGIDPKVASSIAELQKSYTIELADVNEQIRQTIVKHQPLEPRRPIEQMKAVKAGKATEPDVHSDAMFFSSSLGGEDPVREAFGKRRDLDERYMRLVRDMLTPEQAAQLPKPPAKRTAGEPIIIRRTISE